MARVDLRLLWIAAVPLVVSISSAGGALRVAASDAVLTAAAVLLVLTGGPSFRPAAPPSHLRWIALFVAAVLIPGNIAAAVHLGHVTSWGLVNRSLGVLVLAAGYLLVIARNPRPIPVEQVVRWFVGSVSVLNVLALIGAAVYHALGLANPAMHLAASARLAGGMVNPNSYGGLLVTVLLFQIGAIACRTRLFGLPKWVEPLNALALFVALVLTVSRGSWLAAVAGGTVLLAILAARRRAWSVPLAGLAVPALLVMALVAVLALSGFGGLFTARSSWAATRAHAATVEQAVTTGTPVFGFLEKAQDASSISERAAINATALELFRSSWATVAFGVGLGSFLEMAPHTDLGVSVIIHNSFVWALVELGLVGAFALLGLFARFSWDLAVAYVRAGEGPNWQAAATLAVFASVGVWLLSQDGLFHRHVWLVFAVVSLLAREEAGRRSVAGRPVALSG